MKNRTVEEYLKFERASEERHEFLNGKIRLMPRNPFRHSFITVGASAGLHAQLKERDCFIGQSTMRVKVTETGLYTYPDIVVVLGEPLIEYEEEDTLLNPTLLVEVLTPETEAYDRGDKWHHYQSLESLQEYPLIDLDRPHVTHFLRQSENQWLYASVTGLEKTVELRSIGCTIALADVYRQVNFDEPEQTGPAS